MSEENLEPKISVKGTPSPLPSVIVIQSPQPSVKSPQPSVTRKKTVRNELETVAPKKKKVDKARIFMLVVAFKVFVISLVRMMVFERIPPPSVFDSIKCAKGVYVISSLNGNLEYLKREFTHLKRVGVLSYNNEIEKNMNGVDLQEGWCLAFLNGVEGPEKGSLRTTTIVSNLKRNYPHHVFITPSEYEIKRLDMIQTWAYPTARDKKLVEAEAEAIKTTGKPEKTEDKTKPEPFTYKETSECDPEVIEEIKSKLRFGDGDNSPEKRIVEGLCRLMLNSVGNTNEISQRIEEFKEILDIEHLSSTILINAYLSDMIPNFSEFYVEGHRFCEIVPFVTYMAYTQPIMGYERGGKWAIFSHSAITSDNFLKSTKKQTFGSILVWIREIRDQFQEAFADILEGLKEDKNLENFVDKQFLNPEPPAEATTPVSFFKDQGYGETIHTISKDFDEKTMALKLADVDTVVCSYMQTPSVPCPHKGANITALAYNHINAMDEHVVDLFRLLDNKEIAYSGATRKKEILNMKVYENTVPGPVWYTISSNDEVFGKIQQETKNEETCHIRILAKVHKSDNHLVVKIKLEN